MTRLTDLAAILVLTAFITITSANVHDCHPQGR